MQKKVDEPAERQIALVAESLVKVYPGSERPALDGVDITIEAGGLFGLP